MIGGEEGSEREERGRSKIGVKKRREMAKVVKSIQANPRQAKASQCKPRQVMSSLPQITIASRDSDQINRTGTIKGKNKDRASLFQFLSLLINSFSSFLLPRLS